MSTAVNQLPGLKPMEVIVEGKVLRVRRFQAQVFFTTVITPAPDEYSRPSVVEVRSKERVGDPEQKVRLRCKVGGYEGRAYRAVDKETGETRMATPVTVTLDVVG